MSSGDHNDDSPRRRLIRNELMAFIYKAEEEELGKEMRQEGIHALLIAANKLAYKRKGLDLRTDKFIAFPTIKKCLALTEIYEEAEKHYYDPEDEFPLKYIAALKDIAMMAGGAPTDDDEEFGRMNEAIDSDDELFDGNGTIDLTALFEPPKVVEPPKSRRTVLIEKEISTYVKKAEEEELDKEMREEGVNALMVAAKKIAYQKKSLDMRTDKFVAFPTITKCLAGTEIYDEAEKHYYDPEDEFPLKYIAALKDIAIKAGVARTDDDEEMERMNQEIDSDDELFDALIPEDAEPLKSKRQRRIEKEIYEFVKIAEKEELGKEMRAEGVNALIIASTKMAYRRKYYDMNKDEFLLFPSVTKLLAGFEVYEEAEKYYYDPGDDYPLKYIAALRGVAFAAGGGAEEDDIIESMADDAASDDDAL